MPANIQRVLANAKTIIRSRNYRDEYDNYHSRPKQKKRRAQRNAARRKMTAAGRTRRGDGKDVDHKDRNTANNSNSNLRVVSQKTNRDWRREKALTTAIRLLPTVKALVALRSGARHSATDNTWLQTIHDMAVALGASCESYEEGKERLDEMAHSISSEQAYKKAAALYDSIYCRKIADN